MGAAARASRGRARGIAGEPVRSAPSAPRRAQLDVLGDGSDAGAGRRTRGARHCVVVPDTLGLAQRIRRAEHGVSHAVGVAPHGAAGDGARGVCADHDAGATAPLCGSGRARACDARRPGAHPHPVRRAGLGRGRDPDRAAVGRELDRVGQQVDQHVGDLVRVHFDRTESGIDRDDHRLPAQLDVFSAEVIPILQRRELFRTEYGGTMLRDHYGLPWPASVFDDPAWVAELQDAVAGL